MPNDYYPVSQVYDLTYKQDPLPSCGPKEKQVLDPNYYPLNYVPEEEDAPLLVHSLIAPPTSPMNKEEDQGKEEGKEEHNKEHVTNMKAEEDGMKDMDETQDLGQEADEKEEDNYSEDLESDFSC